VDGEGTDRVAGCLVRHPRFELEITALTSLVGYQAMSNKHFAAF
jgi:hypothetical protein